MRIRRCWGLVNGTVCLGGLSIHPAFNGYSRRSIREEFSSYFSVTQYFARGYQKTFVLLRITSSAQIRAESKPEYHCAPPADGNDETKCADDPFAAEPVSPDGTPSSFTMIMDLPSSPGSGYFYTTHISRRLYTVKERTNPYCLAIRSAPFRMSDDTRHTNWTIIISPPLHAVNTYYDFVTPSNIAYHPRSLINNDGFREKIGGAGLIQPSLQLGGRDDHAALVSVCSSMKSSYDQRPARAQLTKLQAVLQRDPDWKLAARRAHRPDSRSQT
ncbi:hypothetical protein FPV67DRAFT_1459163 [Lyophyllum atratum]|nr:hypothetical protein FPV67DRAFT_1459163 [Lyophyllum atratum]